MRSVLQAIAGIDGEAMAASPRSDRMWGTQLAFSLVLSFLVIASTAYFSISYFVPYPWMAAAIALIVALVVFFFDRALFQSDWFDMGLIHELRRADLRGHGWATAARVLKVSLRLAISVIIALTLSTLVEVAFFGPTIRAQIEQDNRDANARFQQVLSERDAALTSNESDLDRQIKAIRVRIAPLALIDGPGGEVRAPALLAGASERTSASIDRLQGELETLKGEAEGLQTDIFAEENGASISAKHTGLPGCGPGSRCSVYKFELTQNFSRQIDLETQLATARSDLAETQKQIAVFRAASTLTSDQVAGLRSEADRLQAELDRAMQSHAGDMDGLRQRLVEAGVFVPLRDDPIVRRSALDVLKADPKIGGTVSSLSLQIQLLIAFLELAPVVAKIFFSPPSAYAARLRQQVVSAQVRAREEIRAEVEHDVRRHDDVSQLVDKVVESAAQRIRVRTQLETINRKMPIKL